MKLSNNQKNIINLIDGDILVSASAGSGKTTVLVKRILNLVLNHGVSINEILIITFTNMASVEMKERIINELESLYSEKNSELLDEQLFLVHNSNIQTFHSFCLEILKNYYYKIDINGNFNILRDSQRKILINEALDDAFNMYYDNRDLEFKTLVDIYGGKYSDDRLRDIIISIYSFMENLVDREKFIRDSISIHDINEDNIFLSGFGEFIKKFYLDKLRYYEDKLIGMEEEFIHNDKIKLAINNDINIIREVINVFELGYDDCFKYIHSIKFLRLPRCSDAECYKEVRDRLKKILEDLKEKVFIVDSNELLRQMGEIKGIVSKLFDVVHSFREKFSQKKSNLNLIDFNDIERLTIDLLQDDDVVKYYREKFKYIFIDEYQDTNYIQEYIVNKIKRTNPNNLFMVGDIKQSIYGFRGACPDLFYKKYTSFNNIENIEDAGEENKILLYDNYRSDYRIINFINYIFENVMVKGISDIEYTKQEYLNCGFLKEDSIVDNEPLIDLSVVISESKELEDISSDKECEIICNYIKDMLSNAKIYDRKVGEHRCVECRDIVILMRNVNISSKALMLQEKLSENDIPIYFDGGEQFFESIEVILVLNLLKVINNPLDDSDLLSVLRCDIFKFSSEDIAYIRIVNDDDYMYNNIKRVLHIDMFGGKAYLNEDFYISEQEFNLLYNKCRFFLDKIRLYRSKSMFMHIDDLIWFIYEDSGYYFSLSLGEDGLKKQSNLRRIFNKAKEFKKLNISGLFNFIEYLNNSKKYGDDIVPKDISENENVVRMMSIHKSKGLEFPIVILCNSSNRFNFTDLNNQVVLNSRIGLGINHIDEETNVETSSIIKYSIVNLNRINIISEELRLLYVALTRAESRLLITGTYNSISNFDRIEDISKCRSFLDFLLHAVFKNNDLCLSIGNTKVFDINNSNVRVTISSGDQDIRENKSDKIDTLDIKNLINNESDISYIRDILNFKYSHDIDVPINLSVSEIVDYGRDKLIDINIKRPTFLDENNKKIYKSTDIGNLYHLFMQNLMLSNDINEEYLKGEVYRMMSHEIINDEDLEYIDLNRILSFFNHDIGIRLLNAFIQNKDNVYREFEFLMYHNVHDISKGCNIRIQGIIDLFFYEGQDIILIDYKTDKRISDNIINNKYREQVKYYSIALEKIFKRKVKEKYIYSFEHNILIPV